MKVSMIGTGYVGLVSGTCFAEIGHDVTCIDIDEKKIQMLKDGKSPIYEPGLNELLERNIKANRLQFQTHYDSVKTADAIFLGVGTPSDNTGRADLRYLKSAAEFVAKNLKNHSVVVIKSTVPVGTHKVIETIIRSHTPHEFFLVNNPEFLKEGSAVEDFMRPDRVIIGHNNAKAFQMMEELYAPLVRQGNPILSMSNLSAEMSKYAANCFLATKISFINEMAKLCDLTGADITEVRKGISTDKRIGPHFLYPGPGYGGSCFPKDVKALIHTANDVGLNLKIINATEEVNEEQKHYMFTKIKTHFSKDPNFSFEGKIFTFWGVAFKANTDDVRETSAITLAKELLSRGAKIQIYDPEASHNFLRLMNDEHALKEGISIIVNKYDALNNSHGLITMTEWREFTSPDFSEIKNRLREPVIFDGRNLYDTQKVLSFGFHYYAIGKFIPMSHS